MEYIRFALLLVGIFGEVLFVIRFFHLESNVAPLAVIIANTLLVYLFALAGILTAGFFVCIMIAVFCLGYLLFAKKKESLKNKDPFHPFLPILAFLFICLISYFYTRGTSFYLWDEFSHWGVIYKYLMLEQHLPANSDTVAITFSYPPFSTLWQYIVSMATALKEENAYFAHTILQFSAVIACFPRPNKKKMVLYTLFFIAAIFPVFGAAHGFRFHSLYVDLLMGLLFAAGLTQIPLSGKQSTSQFLIVLLAASSLALIKPTGIIFSLILITMEVFLWIKSRNAQPGYFTKLISGWQFLVLLILPIGLWLSWNIFSRDSGSVQVKLTIKGDSIVSTDIYPWDPAGYINLLKDEERTLKKDALMGQKVATSVSIQEIIRAFTINTPYNIQVTARNFISKFSESTGESRTYSAKQFLSAIFILTFVAFLLFRKYKSEHVGFHRLCFVVLAAGMLLYSIALFLAYSFYFSLEGMSAPSLERYLATYLIAWWIFSLSVIYKLGNEVGDESLNLISHSIGILITLAFFLFLPTGLYIHHPPSPPVYRFEVNKMSKIFKQVPLSSNDKIYEVYYGIENDQGIRHFMMRYFLAPVPSNFQEWNIRTEVEKSNHDTMTLSPEEWLKLLNSRKYTYVLVSHSDPLFWTQYGKLFNSYLEDLDKQQLFKVSEEGLLFVPLE